MKQRTARLAPFLFFLIACGTAAHPRTPTIDELRARARALPNDPSAQTALAEAELLLRGGDASAAHDQIGRAIALSPNDLRLKYLRGIERELHGHPAEALDAYLAVVRGAVRSDDPLAPALAEVSVAEIESLDDAVSGYVDRVQPALAEIHASPGHIGDGTRAKIASLLIDIAYRRGDLDRVRALAAEQHCVTEWRVAGPFGPRQLLGFDQRLAPDAHRELAERYDYGPSRGERATRPVHARGCTTLLGNGPIGGPGTTYAEAALEVRVAGRWVLRLETPNAVELFVDGRSVARLDRRRFPLARVTYHPLELSAGSHRVRVKIASRHTNPVLALSASRTAGAPGGGPIEGEGLAHEHVRIQRALSRGHVVFARERVRRHLHENGSPVFLIVGAAAALNDPLRSSEVRHDTVRRLLGWAAARDEAAWFPRLTIAQLEANEGRDQAAIEHLREAVTTWPEVLVLKLQLVDFLEQRGWHAEADEMIASASGSFADACRPHRAALNQARRRQRAGEELEHAQALVRCDARSDAMMSLRLRRREWDQAAQELTRLVTLEPEQNPVSAISARLNIAQSRGDEAAVSAAIAELQQRIPQSESPVMMEIDRILARGDEQTARARMSAALSSEPEAMASMRRVLRAVGGESPLEAYRKNGAEVIRAFEASGRPYSEPKVLVLDYTVYRVFDDGSMLELTHNIVRVQSQEAVDAEGEFEVPEDAQILTLHTVKQDGRRLEPDEIAGKDTISFPSLAPGDYVEFEYVRARSAPAGYPGGFTGERFYFRSFETPFDLSQLTVVVPQALELALDPRGPAPETESRVENGVRVYRWTATESRPLVQEPGSVASREFLPSIYWGRGASWQQYVESLRDVLADRDVRDPAAMRLLREILGEDADRASADQRARRIYRWVAENIEDSPDVFGLAPAMLAARTGNKSRVLRYLLELAGLRADLALARSYTADSNRSELPDDETYDNVLVRVGGSQSPSWLFASTRGAPFGFVPPIFAGMDALILGEGNAQVRVSERPLEADLRTVEVDVQLAQNGGGRVSVAETFSGTAAVQWREQLEEIPESSLERQFEAQYVSNLLPGGRLARLVITGRENPEEPLVLRYEVEMPSLARRARSGLLIPPLYRARLGPQFTPLASRTTTQLVPSGQALDVVLRIRVPEGARIANPPRATRLSGIHGALMTVESARDDNDLVIQRSYRIPRMRIEPREYAEFARFCRASDEAEAAELGVRM